MLLSTLNTAFAMRKKNSTGPSSIEFQAKDGFNLDGMISFPKKHSAKIKVPLVILLHSLGEDSSSWDKFPQQLNQMGFAVLAMDLRGHGKSTRNKKGKICDWINFEDKEYSKYPDDLISTISYIKDNYPEINSKRIAVISSNISANAAILAGGKARNTKTLILLSPSVSFKGLDTRIPMVAYGKRPVLIMVSKKDTYSYQGSSEVLKYAQGKKMLKVYPFGGNGTDLIKFQPDCSKTIFNWLKANL